MSDERDEILDELGVLLSIEPSAGFDTRVKREVAQRAGRWVWWPWVAVGIGAAAALTITATLTRARDEAPGPAIEAVAASPVPLPGAPVEPVSRVVTPEESRRRPALERAVHPLSARPVDAGGDRRLPEILVPKDQARALRALMVAAREGRPFVASEPLTTGAVVVVPLPDLAPVLVTPLDPPFDGPDSPS